MSLLLAISELLHNVYIVIFVVFLVFFCSRSSERGTFGYDVLVGYWVNSSVD